MVTYVTLDDAKIQVRVDTDDDDTFLTRAISSASESVRLYLKNGRSAYQVELDSNDNAVLDSSGNTVLARNSDGTKIVRDVVKDATLLLVGQLYKDRDNDDAATWQPGYLPEPIKSLLYPLRDPALR